MEFKSTIKRVRTINCNDNKKKNMVCRILQSLVGVHSQNKSLLMKMKRKNEFEIEIDRDWVSIDYSND